MTVTPPQPGPSSAAWNSPQPRPARDVVVADWSNDFERRSVVTLSAICLMTAVTLFAFMSEVFDPALRMLMGLVAVGLAVAFGFMLTASMKGRDRRRFSAEQVFEFANGLFRGLDAAGAVAWEEVAGAPSREEIISAVLHTRLNEVRGPVGATSVMQSVTDDLKALRVRLPDVIVDRRVASDLADVPLTGELLEPEPVMSKSERITLVFDVIGLAVAAVVITFFRDAGWAVPLLFAIGIGLAIRRSVFITQIIRHGSRPGHFGLIAGVGYIERPDGSKLASWRTVTLVERRPLQPLLVCIWGPDVLEHLHFSSTRDPGFIAFWQRWNHPHPRPELLGEQTAS